MIVITILLVNLAFAAEDARVLPRGRSRFGMIYGATARISENFNATGHKESITNDYNLSLDATKLSKFSTEVDSLVRFLNGTGLHYDAATSAGADHGLTLDSNYPLIGDALSAGRLHVDAHISRQQQNLTYQYGLTERLSLGVMIPYLQTQIDVTTALSGRNTAPEITSAFNNSGSAGSEFPVNTYLDQFKNISVDTLQEALNSRGYAPFKSQKVSGLGDLVLGARYHYLSQQAAGGEWLTSAQGGLSLPTGRLRDPDQLALPDMGSGTVEINGAHIINYSPERLQTVMFSQSVNFTYRMPARRALRVPSSPDDILPDASTQEDVSVRLGDKYWTAFGCRWNLSSAVSFDSGYEFFWKRGDRYHGVNASRDYAALGQMTDQYGETLQLGLSFSTLQLFRSAKFPLPGQLNVSYYRPTRGKNWPVVSYGTAELTLFF